MTIINLMAIYCAKNSGYNVCVNILEGGEWLTIYATAAGSAVRHLRLRGVRHIY